MLALIQEPVLPLNLLRLRPVGVMMMRDQGQHDEKVICVQLDDPEYHAYTHIEQLQSHRLVELERFFQDYKAVEEREVQIQDLLGHEKAVDFIAEAMKLYDRAFPDFPSGHPVKGSSGGSRPAPGHRYSSSGRTLCRNTMIR